MARFSLRDVFWLTLVVGLATGWLMERNRASVMAREVGSIGDHCRELQMEVGLLHDLLAQAGYAADFSNGGSRLKPVGRP